jgi:hypothetical protein
MGKMKPLDASQLPDLLPGDGWERLQGLKDAVPKEIRSIPDQKFYHATVSGSVDSPRTETKYGVSGDVVAGVDVWRFDEKDAERHGINFNKEHYFITRTGAAPEYAYWLHAPSGRLCPRGGSAWQTSSRALRGSRAAFAA